MQHFGRHEKWSASFACEAASPRFDAAVQLSRLETNGDGHVLTWRGTHRACSRGAGGVDRTNSRRVPEGR